MSEDGVRETQQRRPLRIAAVQLDGVPQAVTPVGRYWIPAEPLLTLTNNYRFADESLSVATLFSSQTTNAPHILHRVEQIANAPLLDKLAEVLSFLAHHRADIVVLPEYLLPVQSLPVLKGYSRNRCIVAGLGLVRSLPLARDLIQGADSDASPDSLLNKNVTVLVENERVSFISKRYPAEDEAARPGDGPLVQPVRLAGREVRIGVAVCLDFLRCEDDLLAQEPDVVCIPAFTAHTEPFMPDAPRDYVRVLANEAAHGGTAVLSPSLRGPCFTNALGTRPLLGGVEGIVMVEHDRFRSSPTGLRRTENRLILRSQIITSTVADETTRAVVQSFVELAPLEAGSNSVAIERLSRWLSSMTGTGPLREALDEYRRSLVQETLDTDLLGLLTSHLAVSSDATSSAVRMAQSEFVVGRLGELVATGKAIPNVGRTIDAYQAIVPPKAKAPASDGPARWTFGLRLGAYDAAEAAGTLPRQLNFLRAMATLPDNALQVTYRLSTSPDPHSLDLQAHFDVLVNGDPSVLTSEAVEAQLRSMFVASWPVTKTPEQDESQNMQRFVEVRLPANGKLPPLQEDWSSIADLLRTHSQPISVEFQVTQPGLGSSMPPSVSRDELKDELSWLTSLPAIAAGEAAERRAAVFYSLLSRNAEAPETPLRLSIVFASPEDIPELLLATITKELFGSAEVTTLPRTKRIHSPDSALLAPSQLIRLFHPPYGPMQSRGAHRSESVRISFKGNRLPQAGVRLGSARISSPALDRDVDIYVDDKARTRHMYVVGKTGTGKTNLLKEVCRRDIEAGRGLAVIDPHGDLVDYLASHCQPRAAETVLLDFGDRDNVPLLNPLLLDVETTRSQALHLTDFLRVLESRYYSEFTGPVFDDMVRQALETMFLPEFPVARSLGLIEHMYRNRGLRLAVARLITSSSALRDRWNVFESLADKDKAERITWMLAKFADLLPAGSPLRLAMAVPMSSPLSIEELVWNDGILLIKIPESSLGPDASAFIGSLVVRRLQRAIFDYEQGTGRSPGARVPYSICIDEFQKFATSGLETLVAEARKFGAGLILAHQNLEQLNAFSRFEGGRSRELLNAILGNVGTMIAFRVGPQDQDMVAQMLRTRANDLDKIPQYSALCRLNVDGDESPCFTLTVDDASKRPGLPTAGEDLRARMIREDYWLPVGVAEGHVDSLIAAFEVALTDEADEVQRHQSALAAQQRADVASGTRNLDDLLDSMDEDSQVTAVLHLFGAAMQAHLEAPYGRVEEMARAALDHLLADSVVESATEAGSRYASVVSQVEAANSDVPGDWQGLREAFAAIDRYNAEVEATPAIALDPDHVASFLVAITIRNRLTPVEAVVAAIRATSSWPEMRAKLPESLAPMILRAAHAAHSAFWQLVAGAPTLTEPV